MIIGDVLQSRLCASEGVHVANFSANEKETSGDVATQ